MSVGKRRGERRGVHRGVDDEEGVVEVRGGRVEEGVRVAPECKCKYGGEERRLEVKKGEGKGEIRGWDGEGEGCWREWYIGGLRLHKMRQPC